MDYEKYVEEIEKIDLNEFFNEDEDIPPGLLDELEAEAPEEFHSRVMSSINKQKSRSMFLSKKYISIVAAAMITVAFIGGTKSINILNYTNNLKENSKNIAINNIKKQIPEVDKAQIALNENKSDKNSTYSNKESMTKDNGENTNVTKKVNKQSDKSLSKKNKGEPEEKEIKVALNDKSNSDSGINKNADNNKTDKSKEEVNTSSPGDSNVKDNGSNGIDNSSNNDTNLDNNNESELLGYLDESKNSDDSQSVRNITPFMMSSTFDYNSIVNYDVFLYINETDIINFVYSKGRVVGPNIYRFSMEDYNSFESMLESKDIEKTLVKSVADGNQYINVRIIIN